ncbi:hypothetical protein QWY86_16050 [Pedobacter aquatilis]|uniref:hypothetical protein n=1 Tax=Pedobacter aquatilis TaxID=351343 RepID=UPI0025B3EBE4|nr:hypothetical protein [Pedobacter aquatilis]MDN3588197.1 hypothetical protein [Pedobacter aquatilis]
MDETIETYYILLDNLNVKLRNLMNHIPGATVYEIDRLNIEIRDCEGQMDKARKRIEELKAARIDRTKTVQISTSRSANPNTITVYVISGSLQTAQTVLGNLFSLLQSPLHGPSPCDWLPFSRDAVKIEDFLQSIRSSGRLFTIDYIHGVIDNQKLTQLTSGSEYNLIIIDLMSMDEENIETVRYLDRHSANTLFIPVCTFLANDLKSFLYELRKKIFRLLGTNLVLSPNFFFDISVNISLETEIIRRLEKINPTQFQLLSDQGVTPKFNPGF